MDNGVRLPALQRKQRACRLLRSSEPHWFLGTMGSTSRARWCGVCQATAGAAAFAAAFGAGEHPVFDRAADLNLGPRRLAGLLDGRAADLEDLADLPGEARLSINHLMHHGR